MSKTANPVRNMIYTTAQVYELRLLDTPTLLCFGSAIQTSHLTDEEFLSVPGIAEIEWRYRYTTNEWIPIFELVEDQEDALRACVDIEPAIDETARGDWICPKGFKCEQYQGYC